MKIKLIEPFHYEIKYLKFFNEQGLLQNSSRFFKSFVECLLHPKILQLVGTDDILIKRYLNALQFKLGKFFVYTCGDKEFVLKTNMSGLVIQDINKLVTSEQDKLISHIKKSEYYHKRLIFITSEAIEINNLYGIDIISIPHSDEIKRIFPSFYTLPINPRGKRTDNKLQESSTENQNENDNGNIIPHLPSIENTEEKISADALENRAEKKPENWIEFKLDLKSDVWRIENNMHVLVNKVSYSNSKGLGIMDYLVNECRYPKTISAKELIRIINKRFTKKTKKAPYANPVQSIIAIVRYDLNKIDSGMIGLIHQFQLREECSYDPKVDFDIKFTRQKDSKESK